MSLKQPEWYDWSKTYEEEEEEVLEAIPVKEDPVYDDTEYMLADEWYAKQDAAHGRRGLFGCWFVAAAILLVIFVAVIRLG